MMTLAQWSKEKRIERGIEKGIEKGMEKGIERGIRQGRQEVSQEFVLRLLSEGMSRKGVAEMAGLPLTEIDKLTN